MEDSKHTEDLLMHLEKEKALLMDSYRSMSHDMHRLVVEQSMLMRKFFEFMEAKGFVEKTKGTEAEEDAAEDEDNDQEKSSVSVSSEEE